MTEAELKQYIRDVADFPKDGIVFKDITPLLAEHAAFQSAVDQISDHYRDAGVTAVVGIEARGFILASVVADRLGAGFIPVRKPGKLPSATTGQEYRLEYGTDRIEIHSDAVDGADRVLVVDDVLATGGTGRATIDLVERLGAHVVGFAVLVELAFLGGRARLGGIDAMSLVTYDG